MKRIIACVCAIVMILMVPCRMEVAEAATTKPQVVVSEYSLSEEFQYGEETTIKVSLKNMSKESKVNGVLVTYNSANNSVIPAKGTSNQVYIEQIGAGQLQMLEIPVVILESSDGYGSMNFSMEYMADGQNLLTNSSYIAFPLGLNLLTVNTINVITNTTVGAASLVSVGFENSKTEEIQDVRLVISGDVENGEQTKNIGTVSAGQNKFAETSVTYDTAGTKNISVSLAFNDLNGNSHVVSIGDYQVTVTDGTGENVQQTPESGTEDPSTNGLSFNLSIIFLGLAIVLIIILVLLVIVGSRKKRR